LSWWQIAVAVPSELADTVAYLLASSSGLAAEVRDDTTMSRTAGAQVVLSLETSPDERLVSQVEESLRRCGAPEAKITTRRHDDEDWREGWRAFFVPAVLSKRIAVHPPWRDPPAVEAPVEIDPGMAFGTGSHATTRGVARALDALLAERPGAAVLDIGCGSGVLAIAAARLGHRAVGVEIDPVALENARQNVAANGVEVELVHGSADTIEERFPVVVANILATILIEIAPQIRARCAGDLVLSGLLENQRADVVRAYAPMRVVSDVLEGEWVVLHLRAEGEG
jgi:ribosomal protein L11 methyltransferase